MELRVFDTEVEPLGAIDEISSLLWTTKYFDVGTFNLLAPITENNSKLLKCGNIITKHDGRREVVTEDGGVWRRAAQITYVHITKDENGLEQLEAQGYMLSRWLSKRCVSPQIVKTDTNQALINLLVEKNCGSQAGSRRKFQRFSMLPQETVPGTLVEYANVAYADLGEEVKGRAQAGKLGYDILINEREKTYGFYLYKGKDLTAKNSEGNTPCIFSRDFDKYNRSPANKAYYESDFSWKFHLLLKAALKYRGFTVGTTRDAQANDLDLNTRGRKAAGYDLFISIHSNAVGSGVNNSVDYPVAITMVNDDKTTIDEVSKAVGERLAQAVAQVMQTKQQARTYTKQSSNDRDGNGIFDDEYYGVLNGAKSVKVPGIILEHSFHTNAAATAWLLDDNHLQQMAEAEAATLADYYGMKQTLDQATEEAPAVSDAAASAEAATWYRVRKTWEDAASQVGAYRVKDNAVKNCPEGYSVFDEAGKAIYTNKAEDQAATTWYRVRKTWEDAASQVGAYKVYDNAVRNCPEGYAVFDDAGRVIHRNACSCSHEVKRGDTLGKLAKEYGTTVETIIAANKARYPKISADYIVIGWKLKV